MKVDMVTGWIMIAVILLFGVWAFVWPLLRRRRTNRQILREWQSPQKQPPLTEKHVFVVGKQMSSEVVGIKMPRHREVFRVTVRLDSGKTVTYEVDKEIYRTITENTSGTLAFVGDRVYGYCQD